jgi:glycosyltransferase involved in cell wall biosynthesis
MNILIVSQNIALGGAQRVAIYLSDYLNRNGHQAWILTPHLDLEGLPDVAHRQKYIECPYPILKKVNYEYKMRSNIFNLALNIFRLRLFVKDVVEKYQIDLVNAHNPPSNWITSFSKVPVVWSCNEPISLCFSKRKPDYFPLSVEPPTLIARVLQRIYEEVDYALCHWGIDEIVVLSKYTQEGVRNIYKREAVICGVGADFGEYQDKDRQNIRQRLHCQNDFLLLHVGHFKPEKNQRVSVETVSLLKDKIPNLRLLLVGTGALEEQTRRFAQQLGVEDRVTFAGRIPEEQLPDYYAASDILVFPAVRQSWGLVVFEALSAGVLSLVSSDCGVSDILRDEDIGFVSEPTPQAFAETLLKIYSNRHLLDGMVERGRSYIKRELTYDVYGKKMLSLFQRCVEARAGNSS